MRIIAITNQKGGVGKTTTVVNLAAALAEQGKRIILMDLDPQAHLTTYLGVDSTGVEYSSYHVLTQATPLAQGLLPVREKIKLLPAQLDLAAAEQELVAMVGRETILRDAIRTYEEHYDYIFFDCPPSLGLLTLNALSSANEVFIPLQPHFLSLQGLSQLLESLLLVHKRINPELQVSGLLFCMYDSRTTLSSEIINDIKMFFSQEQPPDCPWSNIKLFETRIRGNIKLAESPSYGKTILEYASTCHGAIDYIALAKEVAEMEENAPVEECSESEVETVPTPVVSMDIVEEEPPYPEPMPTDVTDVTDDTI